MLNLSPDHLDRHRHVEAYVAAKARIFENQQADDWAVVNADDRAVHATCAQDQGAPRRLFSRRGAIERGTVIEDGWIVSREPSGQPTAGAARPRFSCSVRIWWTT